MASVPTQPMSLLRAKYTSRSLEQSFKIFSQKCVHITDGEMGFACIVGNSCQKLLFSSQKKYILENVV